MESNPEAIEDKKQVMQPAAVIVNEEKDAEAQTLYVETPGQPTYTDNPAQATTITSAAALQAVRPSPTHNAAPTKVTVTTTQTQQPQRRCGGGFLGGFATRTKGRFFFPLHAAVVFFSFLVLVSSAIIENTTPVLGNQRFVQYALVVSQISFAVSLGACIMERLGLLENHHLRVAISAFQVFSWAPSLVIITFFGVFISPLVSANGFFGAWGALLASAMAFTHETERSQRDPRMVGAPRTSLLLLFFSSLMIMGAGIRLYSTQSGIPGGFDLPDSSPFSYTVFSIAFGAITAFLSVIFLIVLDMTPPNAMLAFGTFLWLWVAVGILVLTFAEPFEQAAGNGYYACLFALISSFGLLISLRRDKGTSQAGANPNATTTAAQRQSDSSETFFLFLRGGTFASLVVLVAACLTCNETGGCQGRIPRFQIAAGAVPLGLGLIVVLLEAFGLYKIQGVAKIVFALIWLSWWVGSFIVLTFYGSFQSPALTLTFFANGFFFTWVALVFGALAFAEALKERAQSTDPPSPLTAKTGFLLLVIIGSAIELGAAIKWYHDTNASHLSKYALALGTVSIGSVIVLFFILLAARGSYEAHDSIYNVGLYLLTLWWAVGTLVLTYDGFWDSAIDNGYFSVFFTLGTCLLALSGMWRMADDDVVDTTVTTTRQYQ